MVKEPDMNEEDLKKILQDPLWQPIEKLGGLTLVGRWIWTDLIQKVWKDIENESKSK